MGVTRLNQLRTDAARLEAALRAIRTDIRAIEDSRFVGVQFHGNTRIYTYQLAPYHEASVGDYVDVYSPRTGQHELVRVVRMGRGTWVGRTKICRQVRVSVGAEASCADLYDETNA